MVEIISSDLHGRIAKYSLSQGEVITPTLLPVIDPKENIIPGEEIKNKYGFNFIITSAYLYYKRFGLPSESTNIHDFIKYDGNIMMDSGAYQILMYGDVDISPLESLQIQEILSPDVGVILDIPIGVNDTYNIAKQKVFETIERVKLSLPKIEEIQKIKWALPIQGGKYIDLIRYYVNSLKEKNYLKFFDMFALGSVAPIMGQYDYTTLFMMISTARKILPYDAPLHLFGAGHPMIFPYIIALGCDTFDSAAYALFAKEDRYMTNLATYKLSSLEEFPCNCEVCSSWTPKELQKEPKDKRTKLIAEHNLHVSASEIKLVKSAIKEGRLWELLEQRSKAHPKLFKAFKYIVNNEPSNFWELGTPITKHIGIKIYDDISLRRPEITRIREQIINNYTKKNDKLFIIPIAGQLPPIELIKTKEMKEKIEQLIQEGFDIGLFIPFIGIVPLGLAATYPFSQFVFSEIVTEDIVKNIKNYTKKFLSQHRYQDILVALKNKNEDMEYVIKIFEEISKDIDAKTKFL